MELSNVRFALAGAEVLLDGVCVETLVTGAHLETERVPLDPPIHRLPRAGRGQSHEEGGTIEARVGADKERQSVHRPGASGSRRHRKSGISQA